MNAIDSTTPAAAKAPQTSIRTEADREAASKSVRVRNEDFGGIRLKLDVPYTLPGYHLFWEVDEDGAIEELLYQGFEFVTPEEVGRNSHTQKIVADDDLSNRVSIYSGARRDGTPQRQYLLKCQDEVWAAREKHRYRQADEWDAAIRQSVGQPGQGRYNPTGVSSNLNTQFKKEY